MVTLPRLVVAAPSTGQGKTTVATGLMAALRAAAPRGRGLTVSGHKVGPDYIDPGYHALATARPGRNLDPHLVGEELVVPLLLHGASGADVAVVEGVMGLYDGRLGSDGFASTAHVATLTRSPVVLVLDVARQSRTAGAIVAGMVAYDPGLTIAGVVLNRAAPGRNLDEICRAVARTGLPVLGALPPDELLAAPSRHLGLVPAAEREASVGMIEHLGEQVARHLDLDAVLDVARSAPDLDGEPWDPASVVRAPTGTSSPASPSSPPRPVVAVAGGRAFTFRYPETDELLRAAGCEVVTFDPLTDRSLPCGTRGIYLGGGFPEVYAAELAANRSLLDDLRTAVAAGTPTVAECAGLLYLADSLDDVAMAGAVATTAGMAERLTLRYPTATAPADSLLTRTGEQVTGHEFHRTQTDPVSGGRAAWTIDGQPTGFAGDTWHASYLHVHWAGHPQLAQRFADAVHAATPHAATPHAATPHAATPHAATPHAATPHAATPHAATPHAATPRATTPPAGRRPAAAAPTAPEDTPTDPLRHHGDVEARAGLVDFAVNVYSGERPAWLDRALHDAVDASGCYPDATPAREAVARHHRRPVGDALVTSGAAEAFSLVARLRPWVDPVVVHPQFTEPHAALEAAGHRVTAVLCAPDSGFALDPATVPERADLVVVGNPTNPTGVLHPAATIRALCRPGRLVVVDEAFMDAVPGEVESLVSEEVEGLLVVRSLTKHWAIPGIRAGYVVGDGRVVASLAEVQTPWSVSTPAIAATIACTTERAADEARRRTATIAAWREALQTALAERGIEHVASQAPFVLARLGAGVRDALRTRGIAVRRADTFPGLDGSWARIAVRPPAVTTRLLTALDQLAPDSAGAPGASRNRQEP